MTSFNAELEPLASMEVVGEEEAAKMASFLGANKQGAADNNLEEALNRTESNSAKSAPRSRLDTVSARSGSK